MALNRRNIYLRDKYECAFCLTRLRAVDLSLDHVHPRCKGGKSTWENLVRFVLGFPVGEGDVAGSTAATLL